MADPEIQVSRLLDERGFGPFQIRMLVWTIILGMIDGYDIGAIAFAAPHLVRDWHLQPGDVKWVLTASNHKAAWGSGWRWSSSSSTFMEDPWK